MRSKEGRVSVIIGKGCLSSKFNNSYSKFEKLFPVKY